MKVSELIAMRPAIEKLASKEYDLPVALTFAKFARKVLEAIQEFESTRADLFIKYGEKQEDGNLKIAVKNEGKFKTEIDKALNKNVRIGPITVKGLKMTAAPADLINCLKIFK